MEVSVEATTTQVRRADVMRATEARILKARYQAVIQVKKHFNWLRFNARHANEGNRLEKLRYWSASLAALRPGHRLLAEVTAFLASKDSHPSY